ncbi:hypothetical protein V5O48_007671 [Marasmius crinis-equi]|uniref:Integral membrane protein n=1 Tax=Marasmius crinis-equi TaxID=585013 RepID=A0ABR3FG32_9AGAR
MVTITNADGARELVPDYLFSCGVREGQTPFYIYGIIYCITCVVGALHFIRWASLALPSQVERLLWRISTILVMMLPLVIALSHRQLTRRDHSSSFTRALAVVTQGLSIVMYVGARYTLIFLAFKALWHLPPDALRDVDFPQGFFGILEIRHATPKMTPV